MMMNLQVYCKAKLHSKGSFRKTDINAVVTGKIKLFQNYFSLRRRPTEIILFQRVENLPEIS